LVDRLKANGLPMLLDIGVDDFLINTNRDLHARLLAANVAHDYVERPGAHTWEYWENALPFQLLFFNKILKSNGVAIQ
jgi:S-formylglutathione hydrolase FrmB